MSRPTGVCFSRPDEKEALENIKEAITAWLWAEDKKAMEQLKPAPDQQQIVVAL